MSCSHGVAKGLSRSAASSSRAAISRAVSMSWLRRRTGAASGAAEPSSTPTPRAANNPPLVSASATCAALIQG
ncbi:MAG: hypothetical protein ABS53_11955 [Hydrogenophaga sp. SCN 70-13]|nr:MAG: hypothetical protein ABS53_11955 [Hydrogenophaga sp. SCN 70-13]